MPGKIVVTGLVSLLRMKREVVELPTGVRKRGEMSVHLDLSLCDFPVGTDWNITDDVSSVARVTVEFLPEQEAREVLARRGRRDNSHIEDAVITRCEDE